MPGVRDKLSLFPIITALSIGVVAVYLLGSSQIPSDIYPTPASNYKSKPLEIDQRVKKLSGQNSDFIVEDTTPEPKGIKTSNSNNLIEPDLVTSPAEEVSFAQSLTADFIQLAANQLPQDVLLTYLDTATPFKKNEFQSMNDPVSFAGKVAQLATGQEFGFDAPLVSSDKTITNFLVGEEFQEGDNLSVIGPETTRIFSFFELPNYTRTDVLVKWYYSDTLVPGLRRHIHAQRHADCGDRLDHRK